MRSGIRETPARTPSPPEMIDPVDYWARPLTDRLKERASIARSEGTGTAIANAGHFEEAAALIVLQEEEIAKLRADKARFDFLDACNAALNGRYGTNYGWSLVLTHNVTRLMLGRWMEVDLHDSEGGNTKLPSCRAAIDREMTRIDVERRARRTLENGPASLADATPNPHPTGDKEGRS